VALADIVAANGFDTPDIDLGVVIPVGDLPAWDEDARSQLRGGESPWGELVIIASGHRTDSILAGDDPTIDEVREVLEWHVARVQEADEYGDAYFRAAATYLEGGGRQVAWWLGYLRCYSFSGLDYDDDGVFVDLAAATRALDERGLTSADQVTEEHARMALGHRT
jgi:hypothetical protein